MRARPWLLACPSVLVRVSAGLSRMTQNGVIIADRFDKTSYDYWH